jgi:hypothetical protein
MVSRRADISVHSIFRNQLLIWIGVIGTALQIIDRWSNFITLADWAHAIVQYWARFWLSFWNHIAALLGLDVPPEISKVITLILTYLLVVFGTSLQYRQIRGDILNDHPLVLGIFVLPILFLGRLFIYSLDTSAFGAWLPKLDLVESYAFATLFALVATVGIVKLVLLHRKNAVVLLTVMVIFAMLNIGAFSAAIQVGKMYVHDSGELTLVVAYLAFIALLFPAYVAPIKPLIVRLSLIISGVLTVFALSEISTQVAKMRAASDLLGLN